jgi:hypothetical protein
MLHVEVFYDRPAGQRKGAIARTEWRQAKHVIERLVPLPFALRLPDAPLSPSRFTIILRIRKVV